jgi:hypothetical protein
MLTTDGDKSLTSWVKSGKSFAQPIEDTNSVTINIDDRKRDITTSSMFQIREENLQLNQ